MKLLVTGGTGLIGSRFIELQHSFDVLAPDMYELDITSRDAVEKYFSENKIDVVLHLAAFTDTARAESGHALVELLNVTSVSYLLDACQKHGSRFVFVSTDFVFDGKKGNYRETDTPNPLNYYGQSKLEAEKLVQKSSISWLIVRTSYPFRAGYDLKSDCVRWMLPKLQNGETLMLVGDQYVTPTFVDQFVPALESLITKQANGIYHVAGATCLTFFDMGKAVCKVWGFDPSLIRLISLEEFTASGNRAPTPAKSCLNCDKLAKEFGVRLGDFKHSLITMKQTLEEK